MKLNETVDYLYVVDDMAALNDAFYIIQNVLTAVYGILSLSIVCHILVAIVLIRIITTCKCRDTVHNCIYVLALTVVDALVISHLPLLAVEIVNQRWMLGLAWCRFFWVAESVNKLLSTFLLTALCFDRYVAVCFPVEAASGRLRQPRTAIFIIIICACAALLLLSPIYSHANLDNVELTKNLTVIKCIVEWSEDVEQYFTITLFLIGYCIPLLLMAFFYTRIVIMLRKRSAKSISNNSTSNNGNPSGKRCDSRKVQQMKSATRRSFALVLFYFSCWTPFWIISFNVSTVSESSNGIIITFYFMHGLVYLNSAMNPVFYVLFNSHLRNYVRGKIVNTGSTNIGRHQIRFSKMSNLHEAEVPV